MTEPRLIGVPFSAEMIRALLADRKTQTRRLARWPFEPPPLDDQLDNLGDCETIVATDSEGKQHYVKCPLGSTGDVLWVREAFRLPGFMNADSPLQALAREGDRLREHVEYLADDKGLYPEGRYRPARFMPRALSRITLDVTDFPSLERLRSISTEDALAEGIVSQTPAEYPALTSFGLKEWRWEQCADTATEAYARLFFSLNDQLDPGSNPLVWAATFRRRA